jgi:hypothetical protein
MTPEEEMTKRILELKALLPAENGGGLPAPSGVKAPPSEEVIVTDKVPQEIIVPPKNPPAKVAPPSVKTQVVPNIPGKTGKSMSGLGDIIAGTALGTMAVTELMTGDEEPAALPVAPEQDVGLAEVPPAMLERPDRSILEEEWDDVKGDRMEEPVGWATDEADARAQYEEHLKKLDPTLRQGYSFEAFTAQKNREQREADETAERQARTDWAQDRQQVRADDKEWGMKSTMPPEVLADYESKTPEEQRQFHAIWYKKQRARGLNPGDTDSNLSANAGVNENFDENGNPKFKKNEMPPDAVAEMIRQDNIAQEQEREEKFANTMQRNEDYKQRETDRLHAWRDWMAEGSAFGNLPYAQRVAIGRMLSEVADPNAPLESRDVANRRLLSMGLLAPGNPVTEAPIFPSNGGGGQGGQGSEPTPDQVFNAKLKMKQLEEQNQNQTKAQADGSAPVNSDYMQSKIDEYWNTNGKKGTWAEIDEQLNNDPKMSGTNNEDARRANVEEEIAHSIVTGIQKHWQNLPKDSYDRLQSAMIVLKVPGVEAGKPLTWKQFEEFAGKWIPADEEVRKQLKINFDAIQKKQLGAKAGGGFFGANDLGQPDALIA